MKIAFTGHRNKQASIEDIENIVKQYPDAVFIHGGAIGFDSQISTFAKKNEIKEIIIKPDYKSYGRSAPIIRNKEIVNQSDIVFALYDGRLSGGTFFTINFAEKNNKKVIRLKPC